MIVALFVSVVLGDLVVLVPSLDQVSCLSLKKLLHRMLFVVC